MKQKPCFYCQKLHETDSTGMSVCEECKKEKCRACGKELKPDKESKIFGTEEWDGHVFFPCPCAKIKDKRIRISIG